MVSAVHDICRANGTLMVWRQPLAVDLLNPSQKSEEQRHKLKRLVQSPDSYFMDVKCPGTSFFITPPPRIHRVFMMAGASRLFRNHNRLLARSDSRFVWRVLERLVPTHWWKGAVNRGSVVAVF